jgi:hypothetical protein
MNHSANPSECIHGLKDNYRQIRPEDHEVLGVGKVIHGLKDNYRQIRP